MSEHERAIGFFDCDVGIGPSGSGTRGFTSPAELIETMDRCGVARVLCYDLEAVETGEFGDLDGVLTFCEDESRLIPSIPVVPPSSSEQPAPHRLVEMMTEAGIAAAAVWPEVHHFDLAPYALGTLLEALAEAALPLVYHSRQGADHPWEHRPDWRGVLECAREFEALDLVVLYTGMLQGRRVYPMLEACPRLTVDLTAQAFSFVEDVVERFGASRLVCASHLPYEDPALFAAWLPYAEITDGARRAIARGNAEMLFGGSERAERATPGPRAASGRVAGGPG